MAITIDGTNGITTPALENDGVTTVAPGSASAPAITTDGDTNTGIFFPAADTIAFAEGGAEAMRINSSGNVGIGTSSPAQPLEIASATGGTIGLRYIGNSGYATVGTDGSSQILFSIGNPPSERARITAASLFQFNSGYGSVATAYGCRAWVNFNGTGTVAIRGSGNVSSITDNGAGLYIINFSTAIVDANYAAVGGAAISGNYTAVKTGNALTTTTCSVETSNPTTWTDAHTVSVAIFR